MYSGEIPEDRTAPTDSNYLLGFAGFFVDTCPLPETVLYFGKSESKHSMETGMQGTVYNLNKADIRASQIIKTDIPETLAVGEILLAIEKFALTANNITYAATGDIIGYWQFYPAPAPWGIVPVWGFATVIASTSDEIKTGERLYGFFPFASHITMRPGKIKPGSFIDAAEHRAKLPPIYNDYLRLGPETPSDPRAEDIQMLFQPLFATSFLLHDFFMGENCFGAKNIILGSASSKTAMGLARLFARYAARDRKIIGLTSTGNKDFVASLGDYDETLGYDEINALPTDVPSLYIDMSGNTHVKRNLHNHLADALVYSCAVGISHWDQFEEPGDMPGAKPTFFFAPDHALRRRKDWGGQVLQQKIGTELIDWAKAGMNWLQIEPASGMQSAAQVFADIRDGKADPKIGHVIRVK